MEVVLDCEDLREQYDFLVDQTQARTSGASAGNVYDVMRGLDGFTRGIAPRMRGAYALPTHPVNYHR